MYSVLYKKNKHTKFYGNRYNSFRDTAVTNSRPPAKFVCGAPVLHFSMTLDPNIKVILKQRASERACAQKSSVELSKLPFFAEINSVLPRINVFAENL